MAKILGITWYRPDQYPIVQAFCEDGESMDPTYEIWQKGAEKAARELQADGTKVERIDFDFDEFKLWCSLHAKKPNAASRAESTTLKLRERH